MLRVRELLLTGFTCGSPAQITPHRSKARGCKPVHHPVLAANDPCLPLCTAHARVHPPAAVVCGRACASRVSVFLHQADLAVAPPALVLNSTAVSIMGPGLHLSQPSQPSARAEFVNLQILAIRGNLQNAHKRVNVQSYGKRKLTRTHSQTQTMQLASHHYSRRHTSKLQHLQTTFILVTAQRKFTRCLLSCQGTFHACTCHASGGHRR